VTAIGAVISISPSCFYIEEIIMNFDIKDIPFSRYGSWLSISMIEGAFAKRKNVQGLVLRTVRAGNFHPEMFVIELLDNNEVVDYEIEASPEKLRLSTRVGFVEICMPEPKIIRFKGEGLGLRLKANSDKGLEYLIPYDDSQYSINAVGAGIRFALTPLTGLISYKSNWNNSYDTNFSLDFLPDDTGCFEMGMCEYLTAWPEIEYKKSFSACIEQVQESFSSWMDIQLDIPDTLQAEKELAAYINWSCMVDPEDNIKRPSMLMSKNWMTNIWSWDHCFNAIALAEKNIDLAWDQFMTLFDHQDSQGALPDYINNLKCEWNFLKPPIHGWALGKMLDTQLVDTQKLMEVYSPLCKWTEWWFNCRDYDKDGIPQYDHGNDSGWDNSTVFSLRPPIEAPDLVTFLILQMEVLSETASLIDKHDDSIVWKERAAALYDQLKKHSLRDNRFVTLQSDTHTVVENQSLLEFMPLLLGDRLSPEIRESLIKRLHSESFITAWGLATESTESPEYTSDGYWKGPIWAPSTILIVEGLAKSGEIELAKNLAEKFVLLCSNSGFAENFDALTGNSLRDKAYTWTSSIFLLIAHEYL
jgi:putative isomerase